MFRLRARLGCWLISVGYRILPSDVRSRKFVNNAMKTGHINAPDRPTHNGGESDG